MKRMLISCAALAIVVGTASTQPVTKREAAEAIKTFQAVGADPSRLSKFCTLKRLEDDGRGKRTKEEWLALTDELAAKVGPDFLEAYEVGDGLGRYTPEGRGYWAAYDALGRKCR